MQKMLLSALAILSFNFGLLSLPASAHDHTVVQREVITTARRPSAYRRYDARRKVYHRHHHYNYRPVNRTITVRHR